VILKKIIEQVYDYQNQTVDMLKNKAVERGISLSKGAKKDEIIISLMTGTKDTLI
jgi:hypothetical protein